MREERSKLSKTGGRMRKKEEDRGKKKRGKEENGYGVGYRRLLIEKKGCCLIK